MAKYKIFGLEDYTVLRMSDFILRAVMRNSIFSWQSYWHPGNIIIPLQKGICNRTSLKGIITENSDILNNAKSLYIHKACKMPRNIIAQKYKKCLNPWTADAIVVPNEDMDDNVHYEDALIFINEQKKLVIYITDFHNLGDNGNFQMGASLMNSLNENSRFDDDTWGKFTSQDVLDARLDYVGKVACVDNKQDYILDIISGTLPKDKFVYEDTVMKSLSNEENKPTLEFMLSIVEMLKSSDEDIQGSALKALANIDYTRYPNSVITVLSDSRSKWRYNPATYTTAVKFMFKQLGIGSPRIRYITYNSKMISKEDYELVKEILKNIHLDDYPDQYLDYMKSFPFMYETTEGDYLPRLINS